MESVSVYVVKEFLLAGKSYAEISQELKTLYPSIHRGLSTRSIRRYVKANHIKEIVDEDLQGIVRESIQEVSASTRVNQ